MNKRIIGTILCTVLLMLTQIAFSAPALINYQGVLTDASGQAVTGNVTMIFEIWDDETYGSSMWSETHTGVTLQNGVYSVILGSVNTATLTPGLFADDNRWLEVTVNGEILTPRQQITSVAYALNANLLGGMDSTSFATNTDLQTSGSSVIHWGNLTNVPTGLSDGDTDTHGTDMWTDGAGQVTTDGSVGIGTTNPVTTLDVNGTMRLAKNSSEPFTCDVTHDGAIALTSTYTTCVCNGTNWVLTSHGVTNCEWIDVLTCFSSHLDLCESGYDCGLAGGYWWSDNTCNSTPDPLSLPNPGGTPSAPSAIQFQTTNIIDVNSFHNYFTYNAQMGETIYIHVTLDNIVDPTYYSYCSRNPPSYIGISINGVNLSCDEDLVYTFEDDGIYTFQLGWDNNSGFFEAAVTSN